jgi:DNA-binding CsgD family transcriptional regulator
MAVSGNLPMQINRGEYILGRSLTCDIILASRSVSRRHAKLTWISGASVLLEDLASTNGVYAGDALVAKCILDCPGRFCIGPIELFLVTTSPVAAALEEDLETEVAEPGLDSISELPDVAAVLTSTQRSVLIQFLNCPDERKIAVRMDRSRHTIHNHIRDIYAALGVHSRSELWKKLFHRS